jgi:hypothetical protein
VNVNGFFRHHAFTIDRGMTGCSKWKRHWNHWINIPVAICFGLL